MSDPTRIVWDKWYREYGWPSDNAVEYVNALYERDSFVQPLPLLNLFARATPYGVIGRWKTNVSQWSFIDPDFSWPEIVAIAMPSVVTEFSPQPPDPRMYVAGMSGLTNLLDMFRQSTLHYYESRPDDVPRITSYLDQCNQTTLQAMLKRKFDSFGKSAVITGNKKLLIERLRTLDASYYATLHRQLVPAQLILVDSTINRDTICENQDDDVIRLICRKPLTYAMIKQLRPRTVIQPELMTLLLCMFRERDKSILMLRQSQRQEYATSHFILLDDATNTNSLSLIIADASLYRAYMCFKLPFGWCLIVFNFLSKEIWLLDPWIDEANVVVVRNYLRNTLPNVLSSWRFKVYEPCYFVAVSNCHDTGVCVALYLFMLVNECPLCISEGCPDRFRTTLAHILLVGSIAI